MAQDRSALRTAAVVERRPAVEASIQRRAAPAAVSPARALEQRLGIQATQAMIARSAAGSTSAARVSSPHERAEIEAEETARKVTRMAEPAAVQRSASPDPAAAPARSPLGIGGGSPLPAGVRSYMEPRFGASFASVRIHTDAPAAQMSANLSAHAFTVGEHVFFGRDKFQPQSASGRELIAHELTHTIQQGAAVQRSVDTAVSERTRPRIQRLGFGSVLEWVADKANYIPGFRLFTVVLGLNPITMAPVERSAANILRGLLELIPVTGPLLAQALDNYGIFAKVGAWVEKQVAGMGMVGGAIKAALDKFIASVSLSDVFLRPGELWETGKRIFTEPIARLLAFASSLASDIIGFVREAILFPLARLAEGTRGYPLLKAVLGQDPITGQPVPRTAETLIGGFMKLIGQEEIWENLKKANAVTRAWAWFQGALEGLMGFVRQVPAMIMGAIKSLDITDLILLPKAFIKVAGVFGGFAMQFLAWAGNAMWTLLEIIFEVVSPATLVYLRKTGAALKSILMNPLPFMGNLVRAAKLGFVNFAENFGTHLKTALIEWLTGALPGVYIPKAFSLGEIVKFIFSVLGLTWANIRPKLVKVVGETAVKAMETGFDIVVTLVTQGPAAAWDKIQEHLSNLKDQVINGIVGMVVETVIKKAVPKLIAMFIPGAGFISAIITIYDTIMVFVEKLSTMAQVVMGFVDSIVAIAAGQIDAAAKRVEMSLVKVLSLAISFLAGFLGLGGIADKVMGVIMKVRAVVDKGIDALIAWIVKMAKALFAKVTGKKAAKEEKKPVVTPDRVVQKTFSLPKEGHTLSAKLVQGALELTVASDRELDVLIMLIDAEKEVEENFAKRPEKHKQQLLSDIDHARKAVKSMHSDWINVPKQSEDFDTWSERRLAQIVNLLSQFGFDGIKAFADFKGQPLDKRYLPDNYDVRQKLYLRGSGWSANRTAVIQKGESRVSKDVNEVIAHRATNPARANAAWNRLVASLCVPDGATYANLTVQHLQQTQYDVDHFHVLSTHWEEEAGNNTGDEDRWELSKETSLRYITQRDNLDRPRGSYIPWVGPDFVSVYAEGGMPNAKKIDGQPMRDAAGNPIT